MPGKVKVKVISGRNLPVMDRSSDTTDAYVEIKLGSTTYKTDVCKKSLHPHWNSEWYRFEVDDSELQDEPLQIRLMDHDTYSANDAIGKVYLNLNPLLLPASQIIKYGDNNDNSTNSIMSGWIPVYDTMHGIRGEVNITVKVELFSDFNRFRQSSCGLQFFCSQSIPCGYHAQIINGFVEELVVNDDPEYKWIDKIRTPRASNEARQTLFFKLSGELQRKIGVKAIDLGANAVIGYRQCFDLEGESGIVARGIGTAVTLVKIIDTGAPLVETLNEDVPFDRFNNSPQKEMAPNGDHHRSESMGHKIVHSPTKINNSIAVSQRRSSESDLSITPKGNSFTDRYAKSKIMNAAVHQDNFEMMEYPFLTMSKYPNGFIIHLGGAVCARSVKLLERISNLEEPETRDSWWSELRMEIRSHARAFNCNAVLGYVETTSICDDVCVLSASGTAAVISFQVPKDEIIGLVAKNKDIMSTSADRNDMEKAFAKTIETINEKIPEEPTNESCLICHLPYNANNVPVRSTAHKCRQCKKGKVPEILIATIEAPEGGPTIGRGCFIQSFVSRPLKDLRGELNAKDISDGLPFLEYELHRVLVNKLKIKGMNAIFGLKIRISIGDKVLMGVATGTAVFLTPLDCPTLPKLVSEQPSNLKKVAELNKLLFETVKKNKEIYQIKSVQEDTQNGRVLSDDDSDEEKSTLELSVSNKDCCILEVDDPDDAEIVNMLIEERPPDGFHVVNTELVPGLDELEIVKNLQMFTQIYRAKLHPPYNLDHHFQRLLQSVYFKLRRMVPCALCDLQFRVDIPDSDEIQLTVLGMALGLGDPQKNRKKKTLNGKSDDLIFNLEEDNIPENKILNNFTSVQNNLNSLKRRQKSPLRHRILTSRQDHLPHRERHGVDITPLSYVPGGKIERYLGNLNFFFIRETTSIREEGGLSGFIHSFVTEILAIVRAHVTALGGNAMVAYFMTECVLNYNLHKNQGQCLINVGGDVVFVSYFKGE